MAAWQKTDKQKTHKRNKKYHKTLWTIADSEIERIWNWASTAETDENIFLV